MKNVLIRFSTVSLSALLLSAVISCSNISDELNGNMSLADASSGTAVSSASGSTATGGSAENNAHGITVTLVQDTSARSAFPAFSDITSYYGTLVPAGTTPATLTALTDVSGGGKLYSFNASTLATGTYTFYVFGFRDTDTDKTVAAAPVCASCSVSITADQLAYSARLTVGANTYNTRTGSIVLGITATDDAFSSIKVTLVSASGAQTSYTDAWTTPTLSISTIAGGTYQMIMYFMKQSTIVYSRLETVTVWPGCTTGTWYLSTGTASSISISPSDLYSTMYVRGTGGTLYASHTTDWQASDSNTGGVADPLASVQKAVELLEATGLTAGGTIYVDGAVTATAATSGAAVSVSSATVPITIKGFTGNGTDKILAQAAGGTAERRVLDLTGSAKLTLSGLTLSNGNTDTGAGGIYILSGTCTLLSSVSVTGNIQTDSGAAAIAGGIYVSTGGTLYMENGCSVTGNYSAGSVGGICVATGANFYSGTNGSSAITGTDAILDNVSGNKVGGTTDSTYTGVCDVVYLNADDTKQYARISAPDATKNQGGIAGACTALAAGGMVYLGKTTDAADVTWNVTGTVSIANTGALSVQPVNTVHKAIITGNKSAGVLACTNTGALTLTNLGITGGSAANGGGINKSGTGALNLTNCSVYGNTATGTATNNGGGGLYVSAGIVTFSNSIVGAVVTTVTGTQDSSVAASSDAYSNYASEQGGGIYLAGGEVDLTGSSAVAYNYAANGGGIYINAGTLKVGTGPTDAGAEVYANSAGSTGGGSVNAGGTVNIYGTIHHNKAQAASGVFLAGTSSTTMYAGSSIRDNKNTNTTSCGSGVELTTSKVSFTMSGGTISNNGSLNNTSYNQYEVQVDSGTFTMSGSAVVTSSSNAYNSVYLANSTDNSTCITVGGALSGTTPVAKLTIGGTITAGTTPAVALASGVTGTTLAEASGKFALTNSSYFITTAGIINSATAPSGGDPANFTSFFNSIPSGEAVTVKLSGTQNMSGQNALTIADGQNVTLSSDADSSITSSSGTLFSVKSGGSLIIGGGTGSVTIAGGAGSNAPCITVEDGGTLKIGAGATVKGSGTQLTCGIAVSGGTFEMSGGTITASASSGLTVSGGTVTITGGTITGNGTGSYAGPAVLLSGGSGTISNLSITENTKGGGGLEVSGGSYSFTGCTITGNTHTGSSSVAIYGGGIYIHSATAVSFTNCTVTGNSCTASAAYAYGGGIAIQTGAVTFVGGTVTDNTLSASGSNSGTSGKQVYCASGATYNGSEQIIDN